ncbi:DUF4906 domain-containing protein [Bacteroides helcogenes]|uniref:DUF4906 domain-containing protein n=1 Tax=Bacteroides helcogenes (strain ATCC 35417 / DSM 20613 / JCM 6297 / CCUG 15421 / P 36-108) TaxID=693979 RepID=E6SPQ0_BACT6|nr:DUF4906 domain-containing protein [Bacteroides helcogenes]ADV43891.1 hypothetical protein Bache_1913 [Bacteroides helcogenes P 36-108]MDY5237519.1 DUF4906 domain-containing protein [Bacteroides helcogenes]
MKKQNNISRFIKKACYATIAILGFAACADDTYQTNEVEEGTPVSVSFQFNTSVLDEVVTRSLTDAGEFQMNDLYLLIFDSKGDRKKGCQYYDTDALAAFNHKNGTQDNPTNGTITDIETTSGQSYIYGIANVVGNELDNKSDLKTKLDGVKNVTELKALAATLNNPGNIARSVASLLMSGTFQATSATDEQKAEGYCVIPATNSTISGKLYLRRLDSHITFKILLGSKINSFEFKSWQVYNIPNQSYLIDRSTQYAAATYDNSELQATYTKSDNTYSFDFYMQENLKKAITAADGTALTAYKDREKELKNSDYTNTGIYKYVEPYATFVELKAKMEIKLDDVTRIADVRYVIHLGGGKDDFTNFNSLRNKKYTYNVTIEDVNSIIVEVQKSEDDADARPGAEGDVVDTNTEVINLDAHYNCFNIGITKDAMTDFSFIIQSPFAPDAIYNVNGKIGGINNTEQENGDYKWIKLRRTTNATALAQYNSKNTITLYDLADDMKKYATSTKKKTYYYTVFINEYFYDEAPTAATKSSWKTPLWRNFVNKENRKLLLFLGTQYSADKESSYSNAKYLISQKSIQTYYSTETFNKPQNALGMEHANETGAPAWKDITADDWDTGNGFYNTYRYFFDILESDRTWGNFVNYTVSSSFPYTYSMKDVTAIAECLSRNRDENGDGTIDQEELKWYLPSRDQLVSMFLGAKSLPTPMFDDKSITHVDYNDGGNHYITSDKNKIWAEEGCSFGSTDDVEKFPRLLRCVRNLNITNKGVNTVAASPAYEYYSSNRVFAMNQLTSQNKRAGKVTSELDFHDNFSDTNRPYKAFQMANEFITGRKWTSDWKDLFTVNSSNESLCKDYTENGKKWRAPNQREFMIMFLQNESNVKDGGYAAFSRTHWKYDSDRHFGLDSRQLFLDCHDKNTKYNRTIRCVRDVDVDANGNIINE